VCSPPLYPPDAGRGARSLGGCPLPASLASKMETVARPGRTVREARDRSMSCYGNLRRSSTQVTLMNDKLRHRCRNSRCGSQLAQPADSSRLAFCCRGCHAQFYRKRCVVCEKDKVNPNAMVCGRRPCRAELRKWPDLYHFSRRDRQSPTTRKVDARSAHSTGLKTRSVTRRAPLNLVGGYRFCNAIKIEAALLGYIQTVEAHLLSTVELPSVESPPLIPSDPFDIPPFLERRCGQPRRKTSSAAGRRARRVQRQAL
jgi:hypothetical protein